MGASLLRSYEHQLPFHMKVDGNAKPVYSSKWERSLSANWALHPCSTSTKLCGASSLKEAASFWRVEANMCNSNRGQRTFLACSGAVAYHHGLYVPEKLGKASWVKHVAERVMLAASHPQALCLLFCSCLRTSATRFCLNPYLSNAGPRAKEIHNDQDC